MPRRIKLLSVIETLGNGGAERVLVNTLLELQKLGIDCEVAILFDKDDLAHELEAKGIKVHRLGLSYKWNVFEGVSKLYKLVKSNNYDIVHAHLFFAYLYTGLVKMIHSKIKTITTFHNLGYNTYPANDILKKLRKKIDAFIVNKFIDKKTAVSGAVKKHYEEHLHVQDIDVIYNSFPLEEIGKYEIDDRDEVLKKYVMTSPYDTFSITPGRLVKEKGHKYLLEAIERLEKNMKLCHFMVGSGPLENEIVAMIQNMKLDNVILLPALEQSELFKLLKACDIVVIPSISEAFGLVVGEAMIMKKPIVATKVDGIVEMIENEKEGLLVPPKDPQSLADAIERLYYDKQLCESLAGNAAEKIKKFDVKIVAKQWQAYYAEMLNG